MSSCWLARLYVRSELILSTWHTERLRDLAPSSFPVAHVSASDSFASISRISSTSRARQIAQTREQGHYPTCCGNVTLFADMGAKLLIALSEFQSQLAEPRRCLLHLPYQRPRSLEKVAKTQMLEPLLPNLSVS